MVRARRAARGRAGSAGRPPPGPPPTLRRATRPSFDAIVIGSGVGGSVAAGLLAAEGQRVLVLDKNLALGGILASHRRAGFKMDTGSHLVSRGARGPLGEALRRAGLDRPRFLTHRIPVRSRGMLEITAPPTRMGLLPTALEAARRLDLPRRERLHAARLLFQVFTLTEPELRRWDRRTLDEFVRRHTEHPGAWFLLSFLASIFFVLPPWEVSAGEALRCLRALLLDYSLSYVEGGMDALPHALLHRVGPAGGQIVVGSRVVAIRRPAQELEVTTEDGSTHRAPRVLANLAPADLLALLDGIAVPDAYAARVAGLRPSGNAHQVRLALDRPLVEEGCLIAGVSPGGLTLGDLSLDLMRRTVATIAEGRCSDPAAVYAPVPSNYDPSLAPPGRQLIIASIYAPTRPDPADGPAAWQPHCMDVLRRVIPGLDRALLFAEFLPVPAVGAWMGKSSRAAICTGQAPGQVGADRLPVTTPIPGLYLCGDGAGGRGIGTELAASSAMEAVEAARAHTLGRVG